MNTGIQDAANLTWKLALELYKVAPQGLLDTYNEERYPIAKKLLAMTSKELEVFTWKAPWSVLRNLLGKTTLKSKLIQKKVAENISQIHINYRFSEHAKSLNDPELDK